MHYISFYIKKPVILLTCYGVLVSFGMAFLSCIRRIQFCAGHRVLGHESKCANLHGHNYVAFFHARAQGLDSIGRVIDFSVLKNLIGGWIDDNWDHTTLIYSKDFDLVGVSPILSVNKPAFICDFNPTAENMAQFLLDSVCPRVLSGSGVEVVKVVLWETENCFVEVGL